MGKRLVPLLLFCLTAIISHGQSSDALRKNSERSLGKAMSLFREILSIPNDAHYEQHVNENVEWCTRAFEQRGFQVAKLETDGPPLLLANYPARKAENTILIYLQVDGQPVDTSFWNQPSPYTPVLKEKQEEKWKIIPWEDLNYDWDDEWRVFARSTSDAKGPIAMFLTAWDIMLDKKWKPNFNVKVIMDFEEELGSPHLPGAVEKYREQLKSDALIILDGPRHITNRPTLTFGARGIATITLTLFGPRAPQHSGHYGNYAPNPAVRLSQLIASMKDEVGRVTLPGFYDGITIDSNTRAILESVPDDEDFIRKNIGIASIDGVANTYQEALQYPSLNVRGLSAGWVGDKVRTIIPDRAIAEIDIRLVMESDPNRLIKLVRDHIVEQGYYITESEPTEEERLNHERIIQFDYDISYLAFRTSFDSRVGKWLNRALTRSFGQAPVRQRTSGGSIPISPFVTTLDIPAVTVPTVNRDNNQHSPNENLRLGNFKEGIITVLGILTEKY